MFPVTIGLLKGKELVLDKARGDVTIHWKHGSFFGLGGDREQTYTVSEYKLFQGTNVIVYRQKDYGTPPERITVNSRFQYGINYGNVFLVIHDKTQTPYQQRFCDTCDVSYNVGDHLLNV